MTAIVRAVCTRCVMDTSDPDITFDSEGVCNHCRDFDQKFSANWSPDELGLKKLQQDVAAVKKAGAGQDYDCILGLSGGIDSSYLALQVKELDLRPLVVHIDVGWNSELAVSNIEKVVQYCGFELSTHVMDWQEVRSLQLAYLRAGVANQDVVQDHAIFASLYHFAVKHKIKTVLSGENVATESVFPKSWHHSNMDAISIKAINKRFGTLKLKQYKTIGLWSYYIMYPYFYGIGVLRPLNYLEYNKSDAAAMLVEKIGYKEYAQKHGESIFTRFFQNYYLPQKFGMDKRKMHYSSLVLSNQITRSEALSRLEKPLYDSSQLADDKQYIAKKLGISVEELDRLIDAPGMHYSDYPNWDKSYHFLKRIQKMVETGLGRSVSNRS